MKIDMGLRSSITGTFRRRGILFAPLLAVISALVISGCTTGRGDCYDLLAAEEVRVSLVGPYVPNGDYPYDPDYPGHAIETASSFYDPPATESCGAFGDVESGSSLRLEELWPRVEIDGKCTQYEAERVSGSGLDLDASVYYSRFMDFIDPDFDAVVVAQYFFEDRFMDCSGEWAMMLVPLAVRDGADPFATAEPGQAPPWLFVRRLLSYRCGPSFDSIDDLNCVDAWAAEVRLFP